MSTFYITVRKSYTCELFLCWYVKTSVEQDNLHCDMKLPYNYLNLLPSFNLSLNCLLILLFQKTYSLSGWHKRFINIPKMWFLIN